MLPEVKGSKRERGLLCFPSVDSSAPLAPFSSGRRGRWTTCAWVYPVEGALRNVGEAGGNV